MTRLELLQYQASHPILLGLVPTRAHLAFFYAVA